MADSKKIPANLRGEEPTFEHFTMPSMVNERGRLAREGAALPKEELRERAAAMGIPTDGAATKEEIVARVQETVRGTPNP